MSIWLLSEIQQAEAELLLLFDEPSLEDAAVKFASEPEVPAISDVTPLEPEAAELIGIVGDDPFVARSPNELLRSHGFEALVAAPGRLTAPNGHRQGQVGPEETAAP